MQTDPTMLAIKLTLRNGQFTEHKPGPASIADVYHNATIETGLAELDKGTAIYVDASDANALAVARAHAHRTISAIKQPSYIDRMWHKLIGWYWS
jgi:hypothetical protein